MQWRPWDREFAAQGHTSRRWEGIEGERKGDRDQPRQSEERSSLLTASLKGWSGIWLWLDTFLNLQAMNAQWLGLSHKEFIGEFYVWFEKIYRGISCWGDGVEGELGKFLRDWFWEIPRLWESTHQTPQIYTVAHCLDEDECMQIRKGDR